MKLTASDFQKELEQVLNWLPEKYSKNEVANVLANFWLNPNSLPTSQLSLNIFQTMLRVELKNDSLFNKSLKGKLETNQTLKIPEKILQVSRSLSEALLIFLDSIQPEGIFDIEVKDFKLATCFCLSGRVNPKNLETKIAQISIDFGISQKQKLQVLSDQIIKIPLKVGFTAEVVVETVGDFRIGGEKKIKNKVTGSELGLIFDGRGRPIIPPGEAGDRLGRFNAWRQSLEYSPEFKLADF